MSPGAAPELYVVTGASGVGKTTTLRWLRDHDGIRFHGEAHTGMVRSLGARAHGHPPDAPFRRIDDPGHFCPLCRGREFREMVVAAQKALEAGAATGDFVDRGILDPIEFFLRHSGAPDAAIPDGDWQPVGRYRTIFLFEVMPELQRPKWGRSAEERIAEALMIEQRLARIYASRGHDVVRVPPGDVAWRASFVASSVAGRSA